MEMIFHKSQYPFVGALHALQVATFLMLILAVGDARPVIEIITFELEDTDVTIYDNAEVGDPVTWIRATDPDTSGQVACDIVSDAFVLNKNDPNSNLYVLKVSRKLNRDTKSKHDVSIQCGTPPMTSTLSFQVEVLYANNNAPVFTKEVYPITISEDFPVGIDLMKVSANVKGSKNGEIRYSLAPYDIYDISIDYVTGWIKINSKLDHEKTPSFKLYVLATDGGDPPQVSTATVSITVTGVNDHAPVIKPASPVFRISKDIQVNEVVGVIEATDKDVGQSGKLIYSLEEGKTPNCPFFIFPDDGTITVAQKLEIRQEGYVCTVKVTDRGNPPKHAQAKITILFSGAKPSNLLCSYTLLWMAVFLSMIYSSSLL